MPGLSKAIKPLKVGVLVINGAGQTSRGPFGIGMRAGAYDFHHSVDWTGAPEITGDLTSVRANRPVLPRNPTKYSKTFIFGAVASDLSGVPGPQDILVGAVGQFDRDTWPALKGATEEYKNEYQRQIGGAIPARGDEPLIPGALIDGYTSEISALGYSLATVSASVHDQLYKLAKDACAEFLCDYWLEPEGEPITRSVPEGGSLTRDWKFYAQQYRLKRSEGRDAYFVEIEIPAMANDDTRTVTLGMLEDSSDSSPDIDAAKAIESANSKLAKAIIAKQSGQPYESPPKERPAATMATGLSPSVKANADDWWDGYSAALRKLEKTPGRTEDEAWEKYVASGGRKSRPDWKAELQNAVTPSNVRGTSWAESASGLLGEVWDSTKGGAKWLGDSLFDLFKAWGPMGTTAAYAGVRATSSAAKGKNWVPIAIGATVVVLLLK